MSRLILLTLFLSLFNLCFADGDGSEGGAIKPRKPEHLIKDKQDSFDDKELKEILDRVMSDNTKTLWRKKELARYIGEFKADNLGVLVAKYLSRDNYQHKTLLIDRDDELTQAFKQYQSEAKSPEFFYLIVTDSMENLSKCAVELRGSSAYMHLCIGISRNKYLHQTNDDGRNLNLKDSQDSKNTQENSDSAVKPE